MFSLLRWRLTAFFVATTSVICLTLTAFSAAAFKERLSTMLDNQLKQLSAELYPFLEINDPEPALDRWRRHKLPWDFALGAQIQIYDCRGKLTERHGPPFAVPLLEVARTEIRELKAGKQGMRVLSQPLRRDGRNYGWMQVCIPVSYRDNVMQAYANTSCQSLLLLSLGLLVSSYFFAGKSLKPLQTSFELMRQFLSDAGHEFKTPLAALQANVEALEMDLSNSDQSRPTVKRIMESCQRISRLNEDLLLLAALESANPELPMQSVDLDQLVLSAINETRPYFEAKGTTISYRLSVATVRCHYDSILRATSNLLYNALNYTGSGGNVRITVMLSGAFAEICVTDTGIGIAEDELPRIFDCFYRVSKARSRKDGGTGLGLAIVKAVADRHRGLITVKSKPGKGSSFSLSLPLTRIA